MAIKNEPKPEISAKTKLSKKTLQKSVIQYLLGVARGAGFEPARPVRTTGLAGLGSILPPTRLGQPRFSTILFEVII